MSNRLAASHDPFTTIPLSDASAPERHSHERAKQFTPPRRLKSWCSVHSKPFITMAIACLIRAKSLIKRFHSKCYWLIIKMRSLNFTARGWSLHQIFRPNQ